MASSGVVLIRLSGVSLSRKSEIISLVIRQHSDELLNAFTVITASAIRIRKV